MGYELQSTLLRVLETGEFMRIGGTKPIKVDVRTISATNRDIEELIHETKFRGDLFYRLNVISLKIPPLRKRLDDITPLVEFHLGKLSARLKKRYTTSNETLLLLYQYDYPGNVRELFNILEFAASVTQTGKIMPEDHPIFSKIRRQPAPRHTLSDANRSSERESITEVLKNYGRSVDGKRTAAKHLGISLATLYNKIKQHNI
jgi:transcriptional regulator with PAS, ATPase and Fis domain